MIIKAGTTLTIMWGSYSDRVQEGPFRVLKDFDQYATSAAYIKAWKDGETERSFWDVDDPPRPDGFTAWLAKNGYIEDMENQEQWFVGHYDFDPLIQVRHEPEQDHP